MRIAGIVAAPEHRKLPFVLILSIFGLPLAARQHTMGRHLLGIDQALLGNTRATCLAE